MLAHAPIYTYVCQYRCVSLRACTRSHILHIYVKRAKSSLTLPSARCPLGNWNLPLPPVRPLGLGTSFFTRSGDECGSNDERNPARDRGQAEQPAQRLPRCAPYQRAPDCGAVRAPHGLCSPIASDGGEPVETCASDVVSRFGFCFLTSFLHLGADVTVQQRPAVIILRPFPPFPLHTHSL